MFSSVRAPARRIALFVVGSAVSAYGYLVTAATQLGNGPLFAVQDGLHRRTGWSLAVSAVVVGLAVVGLAATLRAPLGPGTLALPVLTGWWIGLFEHHVVEAPGLVGRWSLFVGGTAVMMLGGVVAFTAALGASALDGVMLGLASRLRRTPSVVRLGMEVAMTCVGFALGGRIGLGTVVMGATVGHFFTFWRRQLDVIDRWIRPVPSQPTMEPVAA